MIALLEKYIKHFGVACIAVLFSLMIVQVILRYGFDYTHFLTEEMGRYLLVWATLAGMALETHRGGHIRVGFLVDRLSQPLRRLWLFITDLIIFVLFILLIYTGTGSTLFNHGQESSGMQIPLSIPFAGIPIFFSVAAIFLARRLWRYKDSQS
ncbi:MAG: TRAP-type C4-dicarboxylate transport system permease small subunit [Planctomycetota bacterium]|jgi:TRAP-type C4-dicarboxylate transport system permease small subunit